MQMSFGKPMVYDLDPVYTPIIELFPSMMSLLGGGLGFEVEYKERR